jgi:hypothetical protein
MGHWIGLKLEVRHDLGIAQFSLVHGAKPMQMSILWLERDDIFNNVVTYSLQILIIGVIDFVCVMFDYLYGSIFLKNYHILIENPVRRDDNGSDSDRVE